jgi:hypothetical protein
VSIPAIRVVVDVNPQTSDIHVASNGLPDAVVLGVLQAAWQTMLIKTIKAEVANDKMVLPANGLDIARLPPLG